jgi:PAS domain S-box-containing protein
VQYEQTLSRLATELQATTVSKNYFDNIIKTMADALIVVSPDATIQMVNQAALKLLEYNDNDLTGQPLSLVWSDGETWLSRILQTAGAASNRFETLYRTKRGRLIPVSFSGAAMHTVQGQIEGVVCLAQDISQRKQVEEALRQSEARYRTLFEDSPLSLWEQDFSAVKTYLEELRSQGIADFSAYLTDHPTVVTYCAGLVKIINMNRAALAVYHADNKEILSQSLRPLFNQQSYEAFKEVLVAIAQGKTKLEQETVNLTLTGVKKYITLSWCVAPGSEETFAKVLISIIDITERKQLEEQLRQAQKMEAVGRLAGGIAHDFNNILTIIRGYTGLLLFTIDPSQPIRQDIERIDQAAKRASDLTRQLLAFSRQQILQPALLNLNDIITKIQDMLQRLIGEDIHQVIQLKPDIGFIRADPGQIEQVIINLVVNARDAMPNGGVLTIRTGNVELDETYERQHLGVQAGPYVVLVVTDTGEGMDAETRSHLFEPFFTTKEVGKGTGLGLAMIHGIVSQSNGHIRVFSELTQGTTFEIYLPRVEEFIPERQQNILPGMIKQRCTETILVVEDEEEVRELVNFFLENEGYRVLTAHQGAAALEMVESSESSLDLLLTDLIMPGGVSGRQLAERIAVLKPEIKTLFISGYADDAQTRRNVLESNLSFLQKPFTPDELLAKVRQVLDNAIEPILPFGQTS